MSARSLYASIGVFSAVSLAVLLFSATGAQGATWHVDPSGSGDATTIQAGINLAAPGDTVLLANATYTGAGNKELDFGGKSITVRSLGGDPSLCVVDCGGSGRGFWFHSGEAPEARVEALTIRNGNGASNAGGIYCEGSSSPTIVDCVIIDNVGDGIGSTGSSPTVEGCVIARNSGTISKGIAIGDMSNVTITSCTIVDNGAEGIRITASSTGIVTNTIVAFNGFGGSNDVGIRVVSGSVTVSCCDVFGNSGGEYDGTPDPTGSAGNISLDPQFCNIGAGDFTLYESSPCAATPCGWIGALGVGCPPVRTEQKTWGAVKALYRANNKIH